MHFHMFFLNFKDSFYPIDRLFVPNLPKRPIRRITLFWLVYGLRRIAAHRSSRRLHFAVEHGFFRVGEEACVHAGGTCELVSKRAF